MCVRLRWTLLEHLVLNFGILVQVPFDGLKDTKWENLLKKILTLLTVLKKIFTVV